VLDSDNSITPKRQHWWPFDAKHWMASRYEQEKHFISLRWPYLVWSCSVMGDYSVFTGVVYLLAYSLSRTGHHTPNRLCRCCAFVTFNFESSVGCFNWTRFSRVIMVSSSAIAKFQSSTLYCCVGWNRSKQDQRRGYQLWATSSCTSGTE
jgi:hypothetical protein